MKTLEWEDSDGDQAAIYPDPYSEDHPPVLFLRVGSGIEHEQEVYIDRDTARKIIAYLMEHYGL